VVRAILLDALGTLVALEPPAPRLRAALGRRGVEVSEAQAEAAIAAEIRYYRAHLSVGRDVSSLASLRARCAEVVRSALPAECGVRGLDADAMTSALLEALEFTAFADVRPALASWRARGLTLVVVSNWDVSLHEVLERVGLGALLDGIITSAEVGRSKPAPEIFERALELAGTEASKAIHLGDGVVEDVEGARAAGIEPVLVRRGGSEGPTGVRTIAALTELELDPVDS
jgi:putative hydrolase of the HAD superfamily